MPRRYTKAKIPKQNNKHLNVSSCMNSLPSHSSFRILLLSKAAAKNSMYSMVSFPSVPTPQTQACWQFQSNHSKCSTKFTLCDMAIGVLKHSKNAANAVCLRPKRAKPEPSKTFFATYPCLETGSWYQSYPSSHPQVARRHSTLTISVAKHRQWSSDSLASFVAIPQRWIPHPW